MRPISLAALFTAVLNIVMAQAAFSATTNSFSITGSGYYNYDAGMDIYALALQGGPQLVQGPVIPMQTLPASLTIGTNPGAPLTVTNTLPGGDVTADYALSAFLSVGGNTVFNEAVDLGTTTLNTLLSDPLLGAAVGFLGSLPLSDSGVLPLGGMALVYDYQATAPIFSGSSNISFTASMLDDGFGSLASLLGPVSAFGNFDIGIALSATNVQAVPLPAGLPLMAGAFGLMGVAARRRTKLA